MRAEELDNLTAEELLAKANDRFRQAEDDKPKDFFDLSANRTPEEKTRFYHEAQFYLTALARKRDERVARRDFWMEVAVIVLIGLEIILSLAALREGNQQATVLSHMDESASATADAMKAAKMSLETLAGDQAKSLDRLKEMNDKLQESLAKTGTMATAMQAQLQILKKDQADRLAQLAKKPKLVLYVGGVPAAKAAVSAPLPIRQQTDTSLTDELTITNEGNATATNVLIRVVVDAKDVGLESNPRSTSPIQPGYISYQTFTVPMGRMAQNTTVALTLTFSFSKAHPPFRVELNADADEIETASRLGTLIITPKNP